MSDSTHHVARGIAQLSPGFETSDGEGVTLRRMIGTPDIQMVDPLLMLDAFGSDEPQDYIGGFPDHPHRGFETVTYLLAGSMRHKDNAGHEGVIVPGGVQWMTAGRGIVHSEMPEQENGLLAGFQLWINLPAERKMTEPAYQEYTPEQIPVEMREDGTAIKVIAGRTDTGTEGAVTHIATRPVYLDVTLKPNGAFTQTVPQGHGAFVYVIDGTLHNTADDQDVPAGHIAVLSDGDHVALKGAAQETRFLLVAGQALNEPVAWGGPFVMNTKEEVLQAFDDYRNGRF